MSQQIPSLTCKHLAKHHTKKHQLKASEAVTVCGMRLFGATVAGATLPMFSIIFGDIINALGGSPTIAELVHQVNKV